MNEDVRQNFVLNPLVPRIRSPSLVVTERRSVLKKRNVQKKSREKRKSKRREQIKVPNPQNSNIIPLILFTLLGLSTFALSQWHHLSSSFSSSTEHPFIPTFQKALKMIETTDISWVSETSQTLLQTSNLLKDVAHFTQKFAQPKEEESMQLMESDFFSLSQLCKDIYKLGFNIFAEARTFTKTCSRRLDLVLSVARDDRLNNAKELLTRMSETLHNLVQDHDSILDDLSSLQQEAVGTLHKMALDVWWSEDWSMSRKVSVFSLICLGSQSGVEKMQLTDGFDREARETARIMSEMKPICELLPQATENLQRTRTNLHSFRLQLKETKQTLNTKASLSREDISNLELLIDNAKAFLERLGTKYEDLVSKRAAQL